MLINLSDVLNSEGKEEVIETPLEMTNFDNGLSSYPITEKSQVSLSFANLEEGKARIQGNAEVTFQAACDRCLTEVPLKLMLDFDRLVTAPDMEEDEDADDKSFMEGYQLNVETFVYNEIIGNWPAKILCKEDCKGICSKCGQNLNMGDCGCDTFVPDPRMAVIQDIFNANKEV